eukprot:gnl/TRDRNA2_/TRDRNA2_177714_c1_seq3.p1 gnl/TRDRNA2_/TRDRNA2_177714_c1~~gnl/TRDRNA2_/TRDRNA2_177714_c1_seq3.p1  ORF type:complete len:693 (-),score=173.43 gnl/TRDRNA2_/TRDRNA2_177714_c1_seq3:175-2253(-)
MIVMLCVSEAQRMPLDSSARTQSSKHQSASALPTKARMPTSLGAGMRPHLRTRIHAEGGQDTHSASGETNTRRNVLAALTAANLATGAAKAESGPWSTKQFLDKLEAGSVERVVFSVDGKSLFVTDTEGDKHTSLILPGQGDKIISALQQKDIPFNVQAPDETANVAGNILSSIAGPLLFIGALFLLNRRAGGGGAGGGMGGGGGGMGGMMGIGKSRSKIQMEPQTGVTFDDVAGCEGSKQELTEVVDFLKDPAKYSALGAKIPKGVIMEGPPGTGKTLLARAVAGEAGTPFISASASEFVEMFVGVGASRVRDLFSQAKKNAPCIVFIDEIDAVGRQRAGGGGGGAGGGGNDEREQTLNQILTEMDGFQGNTGVIVIAATNRADVLDNALVRPGRFDRRVPVDLPDVKGRLDILKVHSRGKPLIEDFDLGIVAKRTTGFSGASLANLMNEAAIVAARNGKKEISYDEVDYAIDRITVGMQKTTGMSFPSRQRLVAYHEAGHAIMGLLTPDYDMVTKVTIVPRSNGAGGFTLFTPPEERLESGMYSYKYLCAQLSVALGGRVAEELIYGKDEITTGASNDLQQVRNIARRMVAQWGFANQNMGDAPVAWEMPEGNSWNTPRTSSEETEKEIDDQVKLLVKQAYDNVLKTLTDNREFLDAMAERLVEEETLDFQQLAKMRDEFGAKPVAGACA